MDETKEELMSISSNSLTNSSDVAESRPEKNATAKQIKQNIKRQYTVKVAHVPKRTFHHIQRRINKNRSVIDVKTQSLEKTNCDRFILSQAEGNQMENISPESITRLVFEMRDRLQRKEYGELAKLIAAFTEMPTGKMRWYPTLIKYCLIVLMYDPLVQGTGLMEMFLDGVMGCRNEADRTECLCDLNRLPTNIHVTKYDDLWTEYALSNQLNRETVEQLCQILSKRIDIKADDQSAAETDSDSDSDWESYDENTSNEENEETTEVENVCDFNDFMNELQTNFSK